MKKINPPSPIGLYIHWPFCLSKCPYCDFNSHVRDSYDLKLWEKALLQEISWTYQKAGSSHFLKSIFLGGGTPSLMPPDLVKALLKKIYDLWQPKEEIEVTLEANPTSAEAKKFEAFARAGVNRLSLGVQSFNDQELNFLGRSHTGLQAQQAITWAKTFFPRFSFDLIYALPEQSLSHWHHSLEKALSFFPQHLSCYQLTYEPGTSFYHRFLRGELSYPPEDLAVKFYESTERILEIEGLKAYEVSNYAMKGQECRHNLLYWKYEDYIGIGPGAHGRFYEKSTKYALKNIKTPESWLRSVEEKGHGLEEKIPLEAKEVFTEWFLMGVRLDEGLNLSSCQQLTGKSWKEWISDASLTVLEGEGFLTLQGEILKLSPSGRLLSNKISQVLLGEIDDHSSTALL